MKKFKYFSIFVLFIVLSVHQLSAQTVYITDSGKKYHAKNCSIAKSGKKGIDLKEAIKQGYEPCKMCKADDIKAIEEKATKVKEKEKSKS